MTDDTIETSNVSPIKPDNVVIHSAEDAPVASPPHVEPEVPSPEPDPVLSAKAKLRAFEDEVLGEDAVRINGHIERGHGSLLRQLSELQQARHAALERLVAAEEKISQASADLDAAEAAYAVAEREVVASERAILASEEARPEPDHVDADAK